MDAEQKKGLRQCMLVILFTVAALGLLVGMGLGGSWMANRIDGCRVKRDRGRGPFKRTDLAPEEVLAALEDVHSQPNAELKLEKIQSLIKKNSDRICYYHLWKPAASFALDAGRLGVADRYGKALLREAEKLRSDPSERRDDWNYGNAIHHGHIIIGRVAVRKGNLAKAAEHLLEAGKTPGSPHLATYGPDGQLARELLQKGRVKPVVRYLELCKEFWENADRRIERAIHFAEYWSAKPVEFVRQLRIDHGRAKRLTERALEAYWRYAVGRFGEEAAPKDERQRKSPPVPNAVLHPVMQAAVPSGLAMHCKVPWKPHFFDLMQAVRKKPWAEKQVMFIAVLHGVTQGDVASQLLLLDCTDEVKAAIWERLEDAKWRNAADDDAEAKQEAGKS